MNQHRWRRQQPIGPYIVDFYCSAVKLIIEIDGGQHLDSPQDKERDEWLVIQGFQVLRFWNNDILTNKEGVLTVIQNTMNLPPSASTSLGSEVEAAPPRDATRLGGAVPEVRAY